MNNLRLHNYVDWNVKQVIRIKKGFGYRVVLKYQDGSECIQQKSGYKTEKAAKKAREITIAELYHGDYIVYSNMKLAELMEIWLEEDIAMRAGSYNTYATFSRTAKNHIIPILGKKKMIEINRGDIQNLYNMKTQYSASVAKMVKTVINLAFDYAVSLKIVNVNLAKGIGLPKTQNNSQYHCRTIDTKKTLTMEQVHTLIESSKDTPIYLEVLFAVLMGLRCSEIIGLKYSDIDYVERTILIQRQLGKRLPKDSTEVAPKMLTKQEVRTKTKSSVRKLPIPDLLFEAILEQQSIYEKNKKRRGSYFVDSDYICCSSYGRPRSKNYHWKFFKQILAENNLPDIRWHDLRSTYCTLLLKNNFNPKAVSKLMGHAKEIITVDVYGDNTNIIAEPIPELESFIEEILSDYDDVTNMDDSLLDIEIDVDDFLD